MFLLDNETIANELYETSWTRDFERYTRICNHVKKLHSAGEAVSLSKDDYNFVIKFETRMNRAANHMGANGCCERVRHYLEIKKMLHDAKLSDADFEYGIFGNIATGYVPKTYPFANAKLDDYCSCGYIPAITKIVSNNPDSVVYFNDDTKSVVRCENPNDFDPEKGIYLAILKKAIGSKNLRHLFNLIEPGIKKEATDIANVSFETEYYSKEDWNGCDTEECYDCD